MKSLIGALFLLSGIAFADCEIESLKNEILSEYSLLLPVHNEKGEIGHAKAKNFQVADYLIKMNKERLLLADFELDIKWLKGDKQRLKSLAIATVNPKTCQIENLKTEVVRSSQESPMTANASTN